MADLDDAIQAVDDYNKRINDLKKLVKEIKYLLGQETAFIELKQLGNNLKTDYEALVTEGNALRTQLDSFQTTRVRLLDEWDAIKNLGSNIVTKLSELSTALLEINQHVTRYRHIVTNLKEALATLNENISEPSIVAALESNYTELDELDFQEENELNQQFDYLQGLMECYQVSMDTLSKELNNIRKLRNSVDNKTGRLLNT